MRDAPLHITQPPVDVQESEYVRLLGYPPGRRLTGRARVLADEARSWYAAHGRPWIYARFTDALDVSDDGFRIDGTVFRSKLVRRRLTEAGAHAAMLAAVSAGPELEAEAGRRWRDDKPDEYFFLEIYGSAVAEHLVAAAGARLCAWADEQGVAVLPHYSPGYPGWDVAEQNRLLDLIHEGAGGELPGPLEALHTGMLRPKKSLLAVFGVTAHVERVRPLTGLIPCESCPLPACAYRRAPYRYARGLVEAAGGTRPQPVEAPEHEASLPGPVLTRDAAYSVGKKALRKWSAERLRLTFRDDGRVEARFRYDGTTCSNMGRPLAFVYRIALAGPEHAYRIEEASCAPAPGDAGHTSMCRYLKDADTLMRALETEKPLLGRPLDEVLAWERRYSPAGCYCDSVSRAHKWGLVLEVVHYALAEREQRLVEERGADERAEVQD